MIDLSNLWIPLVASLGLNALFFAIAFTRQTDKFTDFTYGLSFMAVVASGWLISSEYHLAKLVATVMVAAWAVRIISFLVYRIHKMGQDRRFDSMRGSLVRFGSFWLLQAIVAWVVALPAFLVVSTDSAIEITAYAWFGVVVFASGLLIETVADLQKIRFRDRKTGKWIDEGLWHYVRHPNYAGEIMIWLGAAMFAANVGVTDKSWHVGLIAFSPLLIYLMLRYVSGVPRLQAYAENKWGKTKGYQAYKARTGLFLPKPWA